MAGTERTGQRCVGDGRGEGGGGGRRREGRGRFSGETEGTKHCCWASIVTPDVAFSASVREMTGGARAGGWHPSRVQEQVDGILAGCKLCEAKSDVLERVS